MSRDELHTRAQPELGYWRCGCAGKGAVYIWDLVSVCAY